MNKMNKLEIQEFEDRYVNMIKIWIHTNPLLACGVSFIAGFLVYPIVYFFLFTIVLFLSVYYGMWVTAEDTAVEN